MASARSGPISRAMSSSRSRVRAATATLAPACARPIAIARPIPRLAPVTSATRPLRSKRFVLTAHDCRGLLAVADCRSPTPAPEPAACGHALCMEHVKRISIRELRQRAGAWLHAVRGHGSEAVARARQLLGGVYLVQLDEALLDDAAELGPVLVRSLDAIHLAAAPSLRGGLGRLVT